jgi:hypothetical protein
MTKLLGGTNVLGGLIKRFQEPKYGSSIAVNLPATSVPGTISSQLEGIVWVMETYGLNF